MNFRPPPINTLAVTVHPTSLRRSQVQALKAQIEDFDYDTELLNQFTAIFTLVEALSVAGLTNEYDQMAVSTMQSTLRSIVNKIQRGESVKRDSKPYEFLNIIEKILDNIMPYAADGGRRKPKTRRQRRKHRSNYSRKWRQSK